MFSTALSNVDLVVRQGTDMLWFASDRMRKSSREAIRRVYYALLIVFVIWGSICVNILVPLIILAISANIVNFMMALSAVLTIRLNRKVRPKEFHSRLWKEIMLGANVVFFGFFFTIFLWARIA